MNGPLGRYAANQRLFADFIKNRGRALANVEDTPQCLVCDPPPSGNLVLWWNDSAFTTVAGVVTLVDDLSAAGNNMNTEANPPIASDILNDRAGIRFAVGSARRLICNTSALVAKGAARTVFNICIPTSAAGGPLSEFYGGPDAVFLADLATIAGVQYGYTDLLGSDSSFASAIDYTGVPLLVIHDADTATVTVEVNHVNRAIVPGVQVLEGAANNVNYVAGDDRLRRGSDMILLGQIIYNESLRGNAAKMALVKKHIRCYWGL